MLTRLLKSAAVASSVLRLRSPSNRVSLARKWVGNFATTPPPRLVSASRVSPFHLPKSTCSPSFVRYCSTTPNESSNPKQNRRAKVEALQRLFDQSQLNVNDENERGYNLAQFAAARGEVEVLQWLWERNLLDLKQTGSDGFTLVHTAFFYCQLEVLQWLYDNKLLDVANTKAVGGDSLVHVAMRSPLDGVSVLQWLLDHQLMDGSEQHESRWNLTQVAVAYDKPDVLDWLKSVGFLSRTVANGSSKLEEIAITYSALESLKWLAENHLIDWTKAIVLLKHAQTVNAKTRSPNSSTIYTWLRLKMLLLPVRIEESGVNGKIKALQWKYFLPPEVTESSVENGHNLATLAAARGDVDVLQWLWDGGLLDVEKRDQNGFTVAVIASTFGQLEVLEWLHEKRLLDLKQKLVNGHTVVTSSLALPIDSKSDVIRWLWEHKLIDGSERTEDGFGWNLTQLAIASGKTRLLDWLENQGLLDTNDAIDINSKQQQSTLPELAANHSRLESLKWLHSRKLLKWTQNRENWEKIAVANRVIPILQWLECRRTLDSL